MTGPEQGQKVGDTFVEVSFDINETEGIRDLRATQSKMQAASKDIRTKLELQTAGATAALAAWRTAAERDSRFTVTPDLDSSKILAKQAEFRAIGDRLGREFTQAHKARIDRMADDIARDTVATRKLEEKYRTDGDRAGRAFTAEMDRVFKDAVRNGTATVKPDVDRSTFGARVRSAVSSAFTAGDRDVDVHSRHWGDTAGHAFRGVFEGVLSLMPSRLESVFTRTGPAIGGALAVAIGAGLTVMLPAIISGLAGAGFVTLAAGALAAGIMLVKDDPRVVAAANSVSQMFHDKIWNGKGAEAMVQAVVPALNKIRDAIAQWAPWVDRILAAAAKFLGPLTDGLIGFVNALLPPLTRLMESQFLKDLVDIASNGLRKIGEAIGDLFNRILNNPEAMRGIKMGFEDLMNAAASLIRLLGDVIMWAGKTWAKFNTDPDGAGPALSGIDELRKHWKDFRDAIQPVIDLLKEAFGWLQKISQQKPAALQQPGGFGPKGTASLGDTNNAMAGAGGALKGAIDAGKQGGVGAGLKSFWETAWRGSGDNGGGGLGEDIKKMSVLGATLQPILDDLKNRFTQFWTAVHTIFNNGVTAIKTLVTNGINAVKIAWDTGWGAVKMTAQLAWNFIVGLFNFGVSTISLIWNTAWNAIAAVTSTAFSIISTIVSTVMGVIGSIISGGLAIIHAIWSGVWGAIQGIASAVWDGIMNIVNAAISFVSGIISATLDFIQNIWSTVWQNIVNFLGAVWQLIVDVVSGNFNAVWQDIQNILNVISDFWSGVWQNVLDFVSQVWSFIAEAVHGGIQAVSDVVHNVLDIIHQKWNEVWNAVGAILGDVWEGIKGKVSEGMQSVISILNQGITAINAVLDKLGVGFKIDTITFNGPVVNSGGQRSAGGSFAEGGPVLATGGPVPGHGRSDTADDIPIMASRNEYMIRAKSAKRIGMSQLDYMNRFGKLPVRNRPLRPPGFAGGGDINAAIAAAKAAANAAGKGRKIVWKGASGDNEGLMNEHRNHVHVGMGSVPMSTDGRGNPTINALAAKSGIPNNPTSGYRAGDLGGRSWHAKGKATDFGGFNQDALAMFFAKQPGISELIHRSATGDYGIFNGAGSILNEFLAKGIAWVMSNMINPALDKAAGMLPNTGMGAIAKGVVGQKMKDALKKKIEEFINASNATGAGGSGGGSAPQVQGQWGSVIQQAMGITGVPGSWLGPLSLLISRESGGNPRSINTTDSNAQRGDPSRGLMQTIGATFNAYRNKSLSADIYDPLSNIVAGINYIKARYGDIRNVQQAVGATPKGYDNGGWLEPGLTWNGTGTPERVLTNSQWDAMANNVGGDIIIDGDVIIDGVKSDAEVRVRQNNREIVNSLRRGRG